MATFDPSHVGGRLQRGAKGAKRKRNVIGASGEKDGLYVAPCEFAEWLADGVVVVTCPVKVWSNWQSYK